MAPPRMSELLVNGSRHMIDVDPDRSLLGVLRDELNLTGTKYGCGERQCGACVVLVGGDPTPSCVTPTRAAQGRPILTIEGLAPEGALHPLQQAYLEVGALQCGYCTPGMIMAGVALVATNPDPSVADIIQAMDRHICRCGTYSRIIRAIQTAAAVLRARQTGGGVS